MRWNSKYYKVLISTITLLLLTLITLTFVIATPASFVEDSIEIEVECLSKAYTCSDFGECSSGIKKRDCGIVSYCNNVFNLNPSFDLSVPIEAVHEELLCDNYNSEEISLNQILYFDVGSKKIETLIMNNVNISFYHDQYYSDIKVLEINDNYSIIEIDTKNYVFYNDQEIVLDINEDNVDDTKFLLSDLSNDNIKSLSIELIKTKEKIENIVDLNDIKTIIKEEIQKNEENTIITNANYNKSNLIKGALAGIIILFALLLINKHIKKKEDKLAKTILRNNSGIKYTNEVVAKKDYYDHKDHKREVKLIKRKNYNKVIDNLLGQFKSQVEKLHKMKENTEKKVNRNIKLNKGKELKFKTTDVKLSKPRTDKLQHVVKLLDKIDKRVKKVHYSRQAIGKKFRELLKKDFKKEYKQLVDQLKKHKHVKEIKKLEKDFTNKKITHEKFRKQLKSLLKKK